MRRLFSIALIAIVALLQGAATASAVGVAGIELHPALPRGADGRHEVAVGSEATAMQLVLRNIAEERRTVRLHVVGAEVNDSGAPTLLGVADAPFVTLDDQQVTLEPGESREIEVWIDPRKLTEGVTAHYAGFVLETSEGETLLMRAASVVRITGVRSPLPGMPFLIALLLLVGAGAATRRQHRVGKQLVAA